MPGSITTSDVSWPELPVGTNVTLVKLAPDGSETTRYAGRVIDAGSPRSWIAVEARWTHRAYDLDGLLFLPGDTLHEFFSPGDWFNAFSVFAPDGTLRGWYANVTYPTRLDVMTDPFTLIWHDLYLDVVALPNGMLVVRDEDELADSRLADSDPALHQRIIAIRDVILELAETRSFPFHEGSEPAL